MRTTRVPASPARRRLFGWILGVALALVVAGLHAPARADRVQGVAPAVTASPGPILDAVVRLKVLGFALDEYNVDHQGSYPRYLADLQGGYLTSIPLDPATGLPFVYTVKSGTSAAPATAFLELPDRSKYGGLELKLITHAGGAYVLKVEVDGEREMRAALLAPTYNAIDTLTLLASGLDAYAADHGGTYPLGLAAVVPGYLAKFPIDPATNKAFVYTRDTVDGKSHFVLAVPEPGAYQLKALQYDGTKGILKVEEQPQQAPTH